MAKHLTATVLLMIIALVLCSSLLSEAARPDPAVASVVVKSIHSGNGGGDEAKDGGKATEDELESCEGRTNEEECLMRRTMIAHIDYIYTQNNHH